MHDRGAACIASLMRATGPAGRRAMLLIGTSILAASLPSAAFAQNECGPPPPGGGTVTCAPAGNPYPDGIEYDPVEDLTVVLQPGVIVAEGIDVQAGGSGVDIRIEGPTNTQISSTESGSPNDGVHVSASATSYIAVDDVSTTGDDSRGIFGSGPGGSTIIADTVATSGDYSNGVVGISGGTKYAGGDVSITVNSVTTTGMDSNGIDATSVGGKYSSGGAVTVVSGSVQTSGDEATGINAGSFGGLKYGSGGPVTVTSESVVTTGDNSVGIQAGSGGGDVIIDSGTVQTSGDYSAGIVGSASSSKYGAGGSLTITSGAVTTTGDFSIGIDAYAEVGDVEVVSSGLLSTSGAESPGIVAESVGGSVLVDAGAVDVDGAASDAIVVTSATTSSVVIRGLVRAVDGFEVQADGGAATVEVAGGGTIGGAIDLTENADAVINDGTFDAIGNSLFGAGTDVFDNNGTTRVVNGPVTMVGLEQFNNLGTIEMRDGAANDSLTVNGYHAGSTLGIDVDFVARVADVLNTGLATGETTIEVQPVGPIRFESDGILVVNAGPGTAESAFTLAPFGSPYVRGVLLFDAPNQDFYLLALPDQAVFETGQVAGFTTNLWYESADALAAQLDSARDGLGADQTAERGIAAWVQMWTDDTERDGSATFTGGGLTDTFDISYDRDFLGLQGGVDMRFGQAILGLTAGGGKAEVDFGASGNTLDADVANVGVYGEFRSGGFFFNGLGKIDWLELQTDPGLGFGADFDATVWGLQLNGGYRWGAPGSFYAEPSVGISWVNADIDSYDSGPATVDFDDASSFRGRAGIRVGGSFPTGGATITPFAGIHLYKEFAGDNETTFSIGDSIDLSDDVPDTYGDLQAGLTFTTGTVDAFVRGELGFGEDYDSKSVRGGFRFRF